MGRLVRMTNAKESGTSKRSKAEVSLRTGTPKRLERMRKLELLEEARNQLWQALPEITAALVKGAREGNVQHLKLLVELGVLEHGMLENKGTKRQEKSLEAMLMEQWQLDKQERAEAGIPEAAAGNGTGGRARQARKQDGGVDGV